MIEMFIIVEDKPEEQQAAVEAVKRSLGNVETCETWGDTTNPTWTTAFKRVDGAGGAMLWVASNLQSAEQFLSSALRFREGGAINRVSILTDLMFPRAKGGKEEPNGLQIIALAIEKGLPVVVCSDTDHHDVQWLRPILPLLEKTHPAGRIPIILDKKDWDQAALLLGEVSG